MNRVKDQPCVFCGNPSSRVGEHVWPAWFIGEFAGHGLFTASRGGNVYLKRRKEGEPEPGPQTSIALPGVHVPACVACNGAMNAHLEEPAREIVRSLLAHGDSSDDLLVSTDESTALARWLVKVGILAAHPARRFDLPAMNADPNVSKFVNARSEWLSWMTTGAPLPAGFSVYISRRKIDGSEPVPAPEGQQRIPLPNVIVDGDRLDYMQRAFGFYGVNVTIVWHPGWPIDQPQVSNGRAVQLWPKPSPFNFGSLPQVSPKELQFIDITISDTAMTATEFALAAQTPLSPESSIFASFFGGAGTEHLDPR